MTPQDVPIYGTHPVEELLAARMRDVEHIYFDKDKKSQPLFNLLRICRRERLSYNLVPGAKLDALAGTPKHQGVVAFCSSRPYNDVEDLTAIIQKKPAPLFVVAASIEDPGNMGAIIRSCVCLGTDALLLERKNTVPLNATVARASAGMAEHLCIVKPRNLEGLISGYVNNNGFTAAGAEMGGGLTPARYDFTKPTILIIGGEHRGIPPYLQKLCQQRLSIPMAPNAQSLNASVAAGVLMYECMRQRGGGGR
ncbi:MAG: 23S rRNA (guanosine(2251)-2'-O)-methyltransferase RlmB [Chitinispirillia bacterium]|nr:23S rRNA (guanosine(2251)-2'-O)-methyltransferase RlmB [Chitinispirillia bacterium]MCL2241893.1 23S rRNA (guanosine(2251)-2'-O)-methyltransferase RlmB [Chitinispirillia bacterium]